MTNTEHPDNMTTLYRKCADALVHRDIDDECVLLNKVSGEIHHLNPSATCIWRELADDMDIESIAAILIRSFRIDREAALADARNFVQELTRLGLLEQTER